MRDVSSAITDAAFDAAAELVRARTGLVFNASSRDRLAAALAAELGSGDTTQGLLDRLRASTTCVDRVAAAATVNKPLVFGEFGMSNEGFKGANRLDWFRAYFEHTARAGVGGVMFWILTPDPQRRYGVTATSRDAALLAEIRGAAHLFASLVNATPPPGLLDSGKHLVPRQFVFAQSETTLPQVIYANDGRVLYRIAPNSVAHGRFEKLGGGSSYVWGSGVGFFEYVVPTRETRRRVGEIVVRAHLQPVLPVDAKPQWIRTRVTLFVNGTDCGSRLVPWEDPKAPLIQEWKIDSWSPRLRAARGLPFTIRFAVAPESDWPYGVNISNWPEGYDARGAAPVEAELR